MGRGRTGAPWVRRWRRRAARAARRWRGRSPTRRHSGARRRRTAARTLRCWGGRRGVRGRRGPARCPRTGWAACACSRLLVRSRPGAAVLASNSAATIRDRPARRIVSSSRWGGWPARTVDAWGAWRVPSTGASWRQRSLRGSASGLRFLGARGGSRTLDLSITRQMLPVGSDGRQSGSPCSRWMPRRSRRVSTERIGSTG
jgi:hypothetical protein